MTETNRATPDPADRASQSLRSLRGSAPMHLVADRAAGVLVGLACGDTLGVPYEFQSPRLTGTPHMTGGGMGDYQPGEWSDETQLAICIAEVAVTGIDLTTEEALDAIAQRYLAWAGGTDRELDSQTRVIINHVISDDIPGRPAQKMRRAAAFFHRRTGRSSGAGALARTPVIGLSRLSDPHWTAESARTVAELTHVDPLAGDACILVCDAIRRAVLDPLEGREYWARRFNIEAGVALLPRERQEQWLQWLDDGKNMYFKPPLDNTFTVSALQAAIGSITEAIIDSRDAGVESDYGVRRAIENAVRVGGDTDTVAAITGALVGACVGAHHLPKEWTRTIHGWPGFKMDALTDFAIGTALAGVVGEEGMTHAVESGMDFAALTAAPASYGQTPETLVEQIDTEDEAAPDDPDIIIIEP